MADRQDRGRAVTVQPKPQSLARSAPLSHDARELTGGACEAEIVLDGMVYVLRITRAGKLILTK